MRYSVPVNAPGEVGRLAASGADELYCGYLDAWWASRYGDHDSASRRQGRANLSSAAELEATVRAAGDHGVPIHLAFNARYTEPQLDHIVRVCERFEGWGGTGVIVSDLGLLWRLRHLRESRLVLTLSLLAVAQNAATLRAYRTLGISRVVFPRFMGWLEAGALLAEVPGLDAGVMAFFDKCPLVDGYCRHRHGVSYLERPQAPGEPEARPLYTFDTTYRSHACLGASGTYVSPYPCGACHLRHFERAGVSVAKLGGRGRPLEERLRALRFLREAQGLQDDRRRADLYRRTFGRECSCYYGEHAQSRQAIEPVAAPSSADGRAYVGSQSSVAAFSDAVAALCQGDVPSCPHGLTVLVPPLSSWAQKELVGVVPRLAELVSHGTHLAVNDLGTLAELSRTVEPFDALEVTIGTLLARTDDPREVKHFLSPSENPPRPVWDAAGNPRTLTYAAPTPELVRHWRTPSITEPSAQAALRSLLGSRSASLEFE